MEIRLESKKTPALNGLEPVLAEIRQRLQARPKERLQLLQQNPAEFANLEKEIHHAFEQMADRVKRPSQPSSPTTLKKVIPVEAPRC